MTTPTYLAIGHVTRDLLPGGGSSSGGTALYAGLTAQRLGARTAIFTAAAQLPAELPAGLELERSAADRTSTFENRYTPTGRQQWLHEAAPPIDLGALPEAWRASPLVHLGPVLQECSPAMLDTFPGARVLATPQGWMRHWDAQLPSPVRYQVWQPEPDFLRRLSLVVLSIEDVHGDEGVVRGYAQHCPLVALTRSKLGATLFINGEPHEIAPRPSHEVDPTGAGDVFAAALLLHLHETNDPLVAAAFAAQIAGASVEGQGTSAIPQRAVS
jgi:sugar/nucleoside kinase (ribokinase family)